MGAARHDADPGPHAPVLYQQVLSALQPRAGGTYIDGTLGAGGHAHGILVASDPDGRILGLDRDPAALDAASRRLASFGDRIHFERGSFADMDAAAAGLAWEAVDGILLDLGLSSMQLADPARGFSLRHEGPLDMRFDPSQALTADHIVNRWPLAEITRILQAYGEQPAAHRVAKAILAARPIRTTTELAGVVARAAGRSRSGIHPATQTFQALRMAVNDELGTLQVGLEAALGLLREGGRLVVISFHSLEDRMVKQFLRREGRDCICPEGQPICTCGHKATLQALTRRPVRPEEDEIEANPRARSARMRAATRLGAAQSLHK